MHPTRGVAGVLGEVLGAVDVFELRPRIGLASAALAERIPSDEVVHNVVVTASYGVVGRWRESYETFDHAAGRPSCWPRSAPTTSPTAPTARCPRGSASGCRSPAR